MDIEFPSGMSGMDAARDLRRVDTAVILLFITNMAQMAIQGYEVDALDFIVKPIDRFSFLLKMTRVLDRGVERLTIKAEGRLVNLRFVTQIGRDTCMADGEELLIARTQRSQFIRAYTNFLSGAK